MVKERASSVLGPCQKVPELRAYSPTPSQDKDRREARLIGLTLLFHMVVQEV